MRATDKGGGIVFMEGPGTVVVMLGVATGAGSIGAASATGAEGCFLSPIISIVIDITACLPVKILVLLSAEPG
jgi:hypothetical protein